jgi:hypothetical protein
VLGIAFVLFGLLFIIAQKIEVEHGFLPRSFHSSVAFVTISLSIIQVFVGQQKLQYQEMLMSNRRIQKWHSDFGLLIWDGFCISMFSGLAQFLPYSWYLLLLLPCIIWISVLLQMSGKFAVKDEEIDGDDDVKVDEEKKLISAEENNDDLDDPDITNEGAKETFDEDAFVEPEKFIQGNNRKFQEEMEEIIDYKLV